MKIAVIGANGQLGSDVCQAFTANGDEVVQINHADLEVADINAARAGLAEIHPQAVINTAAMHNVEACEAAPAKAFEVNGSGPRNLALLSNEFDFTLFHVSTDYVFDGVKKAPYLETDFALPLNVYGNTKLSGENFVRATAQKHFVVRVSGLYGVNPCRAKAGTNFVKTMLRLGKERPEVRVVDDEELAPTRTADIARQLVALSRVERYGLYHVTSRGSCSWYKFAAKIFELSGTPVKLSVADPNEFKAKVARPKYSVLAHRALENINLDIMPEWEDALRRYLAQIGALK